MSKIKGEPVVNSNGLKIYVKLKSAKRTGKDRISIHVRQDEPKAWRLYKALNYPHGFDISLKSNIS